MEGKKESDSKLYEIGFLLDPAVAEETVVGEVAKINALLELYGGIIETSGIPVLRTLTYTIKISTAGKRHKYNQAYFSWIKFRLDPSKVEDLSKEIGKHDGLIRYIFLQGTLASSTPAPRRYVKKDILDTSAINISPKKVTKEDIDKEVDALIASTDVVGVVTK